MSDHCVNVKFIADIVEADIHEADRLEKLRPGDLVLEWEEQIINATVEDHVSTWDHLQGNRLMAEFDKRGVGFLRLMEYTDWFLELLDVCQENFDHAPESRWPHPEDSQTFVDYVRMYRSHHVDSPPVGFTEQIHQLECRWTDFPDCD